MAHAAGEEEVVAGAPARDLRGWLLLGLRGMAMGIAELVPGVSGGTIAFVTGIYEELVGTLARLQPRALLTLRRKGPRRFWIEHNLGFLAVLALGMLLAIVAFARVLEFLLDQYAVAVWAFFFGLIVASVFHIGRYRRPLHLATWGLLGAVIAYGVLQLGVREGPAPLWLYFVGGMIAVSAWLLPAVSGSFMLLVLGLYEPVLRAFNAGDWALPLTLAAGCAAGLLAFARLLDWLLRRVHEPLLAALTGFMAISLLKLWPWSVGDALASPAAYAAATGLPPMPAAALGAALGGVVILWLLSRLE